jgi:hypothetical protein
VTRKESQLSGSDYTEGVAHSGTAYTACTGYASQHPPWTCVQVQHFDPLFMYEFVEGLCEDVGHIFDSRDMDHVNEAFVNAVTNKMVPYVNVLHS